MSGYKRIFAFPVLLLLCLLSVKAVAQSPGVVDLTDEQDQYPLGLQLEILEDKEKQWTIEDVTSPEIAAQFVPSQEESPGLGYSESAYWVRFRVRNEAETATQWVLLFDSEVAFIDYYRPASNAQGYEVIQTGSRLPWHTREIPAGTFAFHLPVPSQETETILMRFESFGSIILPLSIWTLDSFSQKMLTEQVFNGFVYGVLLILVFYNLVIFFFTKDTSYLFYVLFFGTFLLAMMAVDDFGDQYLWPNQSVLIVQAPRGLIALSITMALLLTTSFLRTKEYAPRLHKVLLGLAITLIVILGLQLVWYRETAPIHVFLMGVSGIAMMVASFVIWRRGYHPARYFLLGWFLVFIGITVFMLTLLNILPFAIASFNLLRVGVMAMATVLSFGLADRINIYRQEKDAAQLALSNQRTQIAQDLHDSVTQSLYSAHLFAEAGQETLLGGNKKRASYYLTRIGDTTQQALKEMRLFLYELRPPDVVEEGLEDALQKRLAAVENRSGMEARLILDSSTDYPDDVSNQFYRISQEALNNVIKHAKADKVTVFLRANDGIMGLEIIDDGVGFDMVEAGQSNGMGLNTMQQRANKINGDFTIETAPKKGTSIQVEVKKGNE